MTSEELLVAGEVALDFGLLIPVGADSGFIGVPWLGFTIPFGNSD